MELHLSQYRKQAGYRSRDAFAESLGVNKYTYRSWESGAAMMSLEQAYDCCVALGCTLNDLVGMKRPDEMARAPGEGELIDCYRAADGRGRDAIMSAARHEREAAEGEGGMQGGPVPRSA